MPYLPYLSNFVGTPHYLGSPPGEIRCDDVAALPADARVIELGRTVRGVDQIDRCPRIERIACDRLEPDWMMPLARLPRLRHLDLHFFRGEELPSLKPLKQLRIVVLYRVPKLRTLEFLRGMTQLHSLCLSEVMAATDLAPLATLRDLRELDIDGMLNKAKLVDSLAPLSKLKRLEFLLLACRVRPENKTLRPLGQLKALKRLILGPKYPTAEYDWLLSKLPQLPAVNGGLPDEYRRQP